MKLQRILFMVLVVFMFVASATLASAQAFGWLTELNIQAQADLPKFQASLATRFKVGEVEVKAVLGNVTAPGDAYMVLRLGEMSSRPTKEVLEQYKANKNAGWGVLAKSLGIKPGSPEFKALKAGGDLKGFEAKSKAAGENKGKEKGKDQEKGKGKK